VLAADRTDVEDALVARAEPGTVELQTHAVRPLERGADGPVLIGHRRRDAQQHSPHRDPVRRLAPGLEQHVEWSYDGSKFGRGVGRRHGTVPAGPREELAIGFDDGDAAFDPHGPRGGGARQLRERRLAGQQRGSRTALG